MPVLPLIEANVPADLDIHLVMDNYGTHKTARVRNWFARHPRFQVHFTPTAASWLNQVEQAVRDYLQTYNTDPTPVAWAKPADDILTSIERFCLRISNSRH